MQDRQERLGRNEGLFREVNNRIEGLNTTFDVVPEDLEIVCECGNDGCVQRIVVPTGEYRRIRSDPTLFMVVPGHEEATVEAIVEEERGAYVVVRKRPGGPAELAAEKVPDA